MGTGRAGPRDPWAFFKIFGFGPKNLISDRAGSGSGLTLKPESPKHTKIYCIFLLSEFGHTTQSSVISVNFLFSS